MASIFQSLQTAASVAKAEAAAVGAAKLLPLATHPRVLVASDLGATQHFGRLLGHGLEAPVWCREPTCVHSEIVGN